jgi:hypothetical protein
MTKIHLRNFKVKQEKRPCAICEKLFKELSSITIRTYDVAHRYKGSNRPIIVNYKVKCCPKCFKIITGKLDQII